MTRPPDRQADTHGRVAVLDIGKTRLKLAVVDADGAVSVVAAADNAVAGREPYPHVPVSRIEDWLGASLRRIESAREIDSIVVVTHGATFALLDADGELAMPIMDYEFDGVRDLDADYEAARDSFDLNLSPSLPAGLNAARQIYWQARTFPDAFERTRWIVPYPQYWAYRLSGIIATEVTSLGCHTDLWAPRRNDYAPMVERLGWRTRMPALRHAGDVLGPVVAPWATAAGLREDCRVLCGIHDSNASLLRHRGQANGDVSIVSTGTWVICMAAGGDPGKLDPGLDTLANVDVDGRPVACARFMGGREFAAIAGAEGRGIGGRLESLADVIARGDTVTPAFADAGGPFAGHAGRIETPTSDPVERATLASVYCALMTDFCLDQLAAEGPVVVEGRFIGDEVYLAALAALRAPDPVFASADETGTVRGAAALAGVEYDATDTGRRVRAGVPDDAMAEYKARWRARLPTRHTPYQS